MNDEIFQLVEKFAEEKASGEQVTVYHLLSAFAKLLSMNQNLLKNMFADEKSEATIQKMYEVMEKKNIDIPLMKQSFPILLNNLSDEQRIMTAENVFGSREEPKDSFELLARLMELRIPELDLVQKGKSLDDTLNYIERHPAERRDRSDKEKGKKPEEGQEQQEEGKNRQETGREQQEERDKQPETGREQQEEREKQPETGRERQEVSGKESEESGEIQSSVGLPPLKEGREGFHQLVSRSKQLYAELLGRVKGQDEAVRTFVEGYFQSEVFRAQENKKKPGATFLFAGPPGVGKTFLAESAAEFLGMPFARFDMSEYADSLSTSIFAGTEKQYNGARPGAVTSFVAANPKSILLFDEIEKAHTNVIYLFLQILDGGVLTDNNTKKKVSFKDTVLLFTTNVGRALYEKDRDMDLSSTPRAVVLDAIRKEKGDYGAAAFPAPICSRFASGNVVMFNHLAVHHLVDIVRDRFEQAVKMAEGQYGYSILIDPRLAVVFLFNQSGSLDARTASSQSTILLKNELYEFARHLPDTENTLSKIETIAMTLDIPEEQGEIRSLFTNEKKTEILLFGNKDSDYSRESEKYSLDVADTIDSAKTMLKEKDYSFVAIDLFCGSSVMRDGMLSMDDLGTDGIRFFEWMRESFPEMPLYLLENREINIEEKSTFLRRGARAFILAQKPLELERELAKLSDDIYLQQKSNELTSRGKVLAYNTMQKLSDDGTRAEIKFYDFKLKSAVTADAQDAMLADDRRPKEKFADVIGAENAKKELQYFVNYMKNPKKYIVDGVRLPKGILLYGPPGTGKTMLARAMAGESDISFFPVTASSFQDKYIGEGEKRIRSLFAMAKSYAPSVIFIDEIDAIGKERTGSTSTHHTESLLNTLLTEMDGFETDKKKPVFVLAATNYDLDGTTSGKQSAIDPALLRRFDNRIYVDLPNEAERKQYLELLIEKRKVKGVSEATVVNISQRTTGDSLAILQNVFELAVRNAARNGKPVDDEILLNAFEEYNYGEKHEWDDSYYREVAVHESGHALVSWLSGGKPTFVTIVSRGNFGGYMQPENQEKNPNYSKEELLWKIRTCLAGRAAEIVFFGEEKGINTGVSSDLKMATNYAMNMLSKYGMSENTLLSFDTSVLLQSQWGAALISEADALLKRELENTITLVQKNRERVERLSQWLLAKNQAMTEEIEEVFRETPM